MVEAEIKGKKVTLESLSQAGAHFGYARTRRHPKMLQFIYGVRNNLEILDLKKTLDKLEEAKGFLYTLGQQKKPILLVGTKPAAAGHVERLGQEYGVWYIAHRWLGGTLTNFGVLFKRINAWKEMDAQKKKGELEASSKKDRARLETQFKKMTRSFKGLREFTQFPAALVVVDSDEESIAVTEANQKNIPVVAIVNTDCDPDAVRYPIPANDNSTAAIELLLNELICSYDAGRKEAALPLDESKQKEKGEEI